MQTALCGKSLQPNGLPLTSTAHVTSTAHIETAPEERVCREHPAAHRISPLTAFLNLVPGALSWENSFHSSGLWMTPGPAARNPEPSSPSSPLLYLLSRPKSSPLSSSQATWYRALILSSNSFLRELSRSTPPNAHTVTHPTPPQACLSVCLPPAPPPLPLALIHLPHSCQSDL